MNEASRLLVTETVDRQVLIICPDGSADEWILLAFGLAIGFILFRLLSGPFESIRPEQNRMRDNGYKYFSG
jgi:hypothetical protein